MKLKSIIVDDEPKLRKVLEIKLIDFCPDVELIAMAENAAEAYEKIITLKPDLIFLDISMPGESGFELLNKFKDFEFQVIFVTGFDGYALDALKLSAVDYLLKPIRTSDLVAAVEKAKHRKADQEKIDKYEVLKHNLEKSDDQHAKIAIPGSNAYDFLDVNSIIRCEGWQKYTKIHLVDKSNILSSYNIGVYKELLSKFNFFSCHKSHLININHIRKYLKEGTVLMSDESRVPISRRRKEEFIETVIKKM